MSYNGLNGTILVNVPDRPGLTVGRVAGEEYGYANSLRVTVELRLERLERQDDYQTTAHDTVTRPLDFAITTAVWRPDGRDIVAGGATVEPLRRLVTFAPGWDAGKVAQLADLERWHLNGMQAGCSHQTVEWEESAYGRRPSLELTAPCPVTGYRYGSAWLLEPLPESFVPDLLELLAPAIADRRVYVHPDLEEADTSE